MTADPPPRQRLRAALVTGGVVAAVLSPLLHGRDSFPLSTFPMFARPRPEAVLDVAQLVSADGTRRPVPPELLGGGEILQAAAAVSAAVRGDADAFCRAVSRAVARRAEGGNAFSIEIARQRWDPVAAIARGDGPLETRLVARCPVPPP